MWGREPLAGFAKVCSDLTRYVLDRVQKRLDLLKELEDSQKRNARQKDKLREYVHAQSSADGGDYSAN